MILIVASRFDKSGAEVVDALLSGVVSVLESRSEQYKIIRVAGANEIPVTIRHFITKYPSVYSVAVALGLILKGDTDHYEMVRDSSTMGITHVSLEFGIPIVQGILACYTKEQAIDRKYLGEEFGNTALEMQDIIRL